jgi:hypothetical protein
VIGYLPFSRSSMLAGAVYCSETVCLIQAIDTALASLGGGSSRACPASSWARSFPGPLLWPCTQSIEAVFPWAFSRWICGMTFVARDWPGPVLLCYTRAIADVESEKNDRCLNACWDLETALMPSSIAATSAS